MEVTYVIIVFIFTYILGAISKFKFESIPNKLIPFQNVLIGVVSALFCYFTKIEPNFVQAFVLCMLSAMGAGGTSDLKKVKEKNSLSYTK